MRTGRQGPAGDPEQDGRLKGRHGGEAPKSPPRSRKAEPARAEAEASEGNDLTPRDHTGAEGNVFHHAKKHAGQHEG